MTTANCDLQQYPSFVVPSLMYEVIYVHEYTTIEVMNRIIKKILDNHGMDETHVKKIDGNLIIGIKRKYLVEEKDRTLPHNAFDRYNYYKYRHQSCRRLRRGS